MLLNRRYAMAVMAALFAAPALAQAPAPVPVTADNFVRAETDLYLSNVVKDGGFGKFVHRRELTPIDKQVVVRQNRDTLYSAAVFDLDAGPVTITLPDAGDRFVSMQVIDEDQYTPQVTYSPAAIPCPKDIGTRYVIVGCACWSNPTDPDVEAVHALQDAIRVEQPGGPGTFDVPKWDQASQKTVRRAARAGLDTARHEAHVRHEGGTSIRCAA